MILLPIFHKFLKALYSSIKEKLKIKIMHLILKYN